MWGISLCWRRKEYILLYLTRGYIGKKKESSRNTPISRQPHLHTTNLYFIKIPLAMIFISISTPLMTSVDSTIIVIVVDPHPMILTQLTFRTCSQFISLIMQNLAKDEGNTIKLYTIHITSWDLQVVSILPIPSAADRHT